MTRLELRVVLAAWLAGTVVFGAVVCAAYGWTIVASVLSIYALGVGAWLYHSIERLILARRISTVRQAAKPLQPLLPVMAAIMGLTQAVVRSLSDVTDLPARRWDFPQRSVLKWVENPLGMRSNRRIVDSEVDSDDHPGH
ncbi:MAG: antitermination protein NusB [Mycobacterium sp.]|uniref:antitermination protein NusB n=1 Tax=Mycobacterium sp. TaxID=1785 RepID=UPI001EB90751|nr:antitermination protein NusB [Mycobacterium sp.]MBW0016903.1 antitermination protein NusB [Mycobacterium sp.]